MSHKLVMTSDSLYNLYQRRFADVTDKVIDDIVHFVVYYTEEKLREYRELPFTVMASFEKQPINKESAMKISSLLETHYGLIVDVHVDGFCIVKDIVKVGDDVVR